MNSKVLDGIAFWAVVAYLVHRGFRAQQERREKNVPLNKKALEFYKSIREKLITEETNAKHSTDW